MIYITGDTHIPVDINKLSSKRFPEQKDMTPQDYLIICGDFGGVWCGDNEELYWCKWLDKKNFTTLFIDGNHENFDILGSFPIVDFYEGKAHKISNKIYHLMVGVAVEKTGLSGSTIGNAYQTIFSRITKASEIEGTPLDDISKAEEALRGIGVQVRSSNNDFRDMTDIMADIGRVWDGLTDTEKSKVGHTVAGTEQLNVLNSLFGAWDEYSAIVENADDRVGMAIKNQEEYADSLGGRLEKLGATGKSIWNNILNTEEVKGTISFLTDLLGIIDKITGALGTWGTIGALSGLLMNKNGIGKLTKFQWQFVLCPPF